MASVLLKAKTGKLPPEIEEGNIEYKRKLLCNDERFVKLTSQLKWRLSEGKGEAHYCLGVEDDGTPVGLSGVELKKTLETMSRMVVSLDATIHSRDFFPGSLPGSKWIHVTIRKKMVEKVPVEVRYLVLGGPGNGKSTVIASVISNALDDGQGSGRMHVMRHKHELDNGHTSCVSYHALGYNNESKPLLEEEEEMPTGVFFGGECDSVGHGSRHGEPVHKVCTMIDVPGHPRYLKTTIRGFMAYSPHYAIVTVAASELSSFARDQAKNPNSASTVGVVLGEGGESTARDEIGTGLLDNFDSIAITINHIRIVRILKLPIMIVITKSDLLREAQQEPGLKDSQVIKNGIKRLLAAAEYEAATLSLHSSPTELSEWADSTEPGKEIKVPYFLTSSVRLDGIDSLRCFIGTVKPKNLLRKRGEVNACLHLREAFDVPGVGVVAGGVCEYGSIRVGDRVRIGPDSDANYVEVLVSSIRTDQGYRSQQVVQGQSACLAFDLPPGEPVTSSGKLPESGGSFTSSSWSVSDSIISNEQDNFNENDDITSFHWSEFWTPPSVHSQESAFSTNLLTVKNAVIRGLIRKGAVVVKTKNVLNPYQGLLYKPYPVVVREFKVLLLDLIESIKSTKRKNLVVQKNWHFVVYANSVKQTAFVTRANHETVESKVGTSSTRTCLSLRFMKRSEHLAIGTTIMLSNGYSFGVAKVSEVTPFLPQ